MSTRRCSAESHSCARINRHTVFSHVQLHDYGTIRVCTLKREPPSFPSHPKYAPFLENRDIDLFILGRGIVGLRLIIYLFGRYMYSSDTGRLIYLR